MRLKRFFPLVPTTTLLLVLPVLATDVEPNLLQPTTSPGAIHVRSLTGNGYEVNVIRLNRTLYTGECPGQLIRVGKAYFISSSTLPAPGRRVVIRNVSPGMDNDPYPYTDRGYDKGQYSQGFDVSLDSNHQTRNFSVKEGVNQFNYEIKEQKNVIESGSFTVEVAVQYSPSVSRSQTCRNVWKCDDDFGNLEIPADLLPEGFPKPPKPRPQNCRFEQECSCPFP